MSGEMKDTAALGTGSVIIDNYVPKALRVKVNINISIYENDLNLILNIK